MRNVTFIIPFRAKKTCRDWSAVSRALLGTLASIANQSASNCRCILVCHEVPEGFVANSSIRVLEVDFPPPADRKGFKRDKGMKVAAGIKAYLQHPTDLYMVLDADDRVHKDLGDYLGQGAAPSYVITCGYVYGGGPWLRAHAGTFDRLCGSVCVSNKEDAASGFVPLALGHQNIVRHFQDKGRELGQVPFFAALKNVAYGENITETKFILSKSIARSLKKLAMLRFLTSQTKRNFALDLCPITA